MSLKKYVRLELQAKLIGDIQQQTTEAMYVKCLKWTTLGAVPKTAELHHTLAITNMATERNIEVTSNTFNTLRTGDANLRF